MRKFLVVLVVACMMVLPLTGYAKKDDSGINVSAASAILIDADSGTVMYEKNADTPLPIASVTKVMTLVLTFEAIKNNAFSLDDSVMISENAASMGGSQAFIDAGYSYKVSDLIKSVIIASANDAAVALAELVAGSEDAFVAKMNKRAQGLSMNNTVFKNCTGLPESGHLSTARDVSKMSRELLRYKDYFQWSNVWMDELHHEKDGRVTELVNTNRLIRSLNGCDGLKTGYTSEAKFCVTASAVRGDMRLISVILGAETSKQRFDDASMLINYGFSGYARKNVVSTGESIGTVPFSGGIEKEAKLIASDSFSLCLKNDGEDKVETRLELFDNLKAPIKKGQELGRIVVLLNGKEQGSVILVSGEDHKKAGLLDRIKGILSIWN